MMYAFRILVCAALLSHFFAASAARAQSSPIDNQPKVHASLVAEREGVAPGGQVTVALREVIRKNWHTYWRNPGDSGEPTHITWHLPQGWKAGEIEWPYPKRLPVGPLMDFGYETEVALLVPLTAPSDAKPGDVAQISAHVLWLVCAEVCIPEETDLSLDLKIEAKEPQPNPAWTAFFTNARAHLPQTSPWPATYSATKDKFAIFVHSHDLAAARPRDGFFFPVKDGTISNPAPQRLSVIQSGVLLSAKSGWRLADAQKRASLGEVEGVLVLVGGDGREDAIVVSAKPGAVPVGAESTIGFGLAVLFAFLGGLILNLMPCVLPVLSIKALALAGKGGGQSAHREALAYGAGVLLTFVSLAALIIGLRETGQSLGWGFQLQEPLVVAAFALLMFVVGLNLSGVFEIGASITNFGEHLVRHGGAIGSFVTGALAVMVAAPCTAPFMGAAMGFALVQPAAIALAVFVALGLGFAAPFVALGFSPGLLRLLPKPGAWTETLRQFLAFPMYATSIWLAWVLSLQAGLNAVVVLLGAALSLGFAFWALGAGQKSAARRPLLWIAVVIGLVGTFLLLPAIQAEKPTAFKPASIIPSEPYSAARLANLRAEGRPVFVNVTAAWCITCLVNERLALQQQSVVEIFRRKNVAYLIADWTNRNAEVAQLLDQYGRSGVPLYLYFPPQGEGVVLPQILTESIIRSTVGGQKQEENKP